MNPDDIREVKTLEQLEEAIIAALDVYPERSVTADGTVSTSPPLRSCFVRDQERVHVHAGDKPCPRDVLPLYITVRLPYRASDMWEHAERAGREDLGRYILNLLMTNPGTRTWSGRIVSQSRDDAPMGYREVRFQAWLDSTDPWPKEVPGRAV